MPKKLQRLGQAVREFQQYMDEMLARERSSASTEQSGTPNLMSALVRASDEASQSKDLGQDSKRGLTDEEIFGNIFAYNLAGHETTANTVAFALVLLAAQPRYQDWVREEIREAQAATKGDYESMFPRLQRCLAVMRQYETLRLYGSIVFIPRATSDEPQTLHSPGGKDITIPPSTAVNINVQALHTDPKTWGPDTLNWRPDSWFIPSPTSKERPSQQHQTFISPPQGSFIPWADGPRVCPGQKFAQVEFVAVLATLLGGYRVMPVLREGQGEEEGRKALMGMVDDSAITAITLQMREPRKVALRWEGVV
ncbi:MAG: hypothetical protein Q9208_008076 [Pyrenodesmia sp. 3 TL-2023]